MVCGAHASERSKLCHLKKKKKKNFNKRRAPSAVRKSSCMAGWVE